MTEDAIETARRIENEVEDRWDIRMPTREQTIRMDCLKLALGYYQTDKKSADDIGNIVEHWSELIIEGEN